MSTLAKIEANKRNAALSTGPRTPEGKLVAARNAATHGIFAAVPVLPGESADAWERHRAGVVESLAPVGLLEVNLAERAALLLWRLQRLARYEAETVAAAMEDAEVPPLPPATDFAAPVDHERPTRDGQLNKLRRELRDARRDLEAVARLLDGRAERKRAARLLPGDGRDERIAKYERHLHGLLTSTLHELERLQARREGQTVPLPAVADVNVTTGATAD